MAKINTGTKCTVCEQCVVAEVKERPGQDCEVIFHCSNIVCNLLFYAPPGRPNAREEILAELRANASERLDHADNSTLA